MQTTQQFKQKIKHIKRIVGYIDSYRDIYKSDPFYNNQWREEMAKDVALDHFGLNPDDLVLHPHGTSGPDFMCSRLGIKKGEMKGAWFKARSMTPKSIGCAQFDKQNDKYRRAEIFDYDALIYTAFERDSDIVFTIIVVGEQNMKRLHLLFRRAHRVIHEKILACKKADKKINRDAIEISAFDIIERLKENEMVILVRGKVVSRRKFLDMVQRREKI